MKNDRRGAVIGLICILTLVPTSVASAAVNRLPARLDSALPPGQTKGRRGWMLDDIIQVRTITDVAINDSTRQIAFLIRQAFVRGNEVRYGLYAVNPLSPGPARKLLEASYLADLSWHPGTDRWTVRADLGKGVQLYDVDPSGKCYPLIINTRTELHGGYAGAAVTPVGYTRPVGVLSYQWARDGSRLWYARFRVRTKPERQAILDAGIPFTSRTFSSYWFMDPPAAHLGTELRLFSPGSKLDRLLVFVPSAMWTDADELFSHRWGNAWWEADDRHIDYTSYSPQAGGTLRLELWSVDSETGRQQRELTGSASNLIAGAVPNPAGAGFLATVPKSGVSHLVQLDAAGRTVSDAGEAQGFEIYKWLGHWGGSEGAPIVLGVRFRNREGLISIPRAAGSALQAVEGNLGPCAFTRDLSLGACVRQSVTLPPELVSVSLKGGILKTLARPNAGYDAIAPLRVQPMEWTNKYGNISDGYVTYPPGYNPRQTYPVLVVTHGRDAINTFADQDIQWDYPIQVFAEEGYVVLEVNEPERNPKTRAAYEAWMNMNGNTNIAGMQFVIAYDAVASMEAAVKWAIARGIANPREVGIAGYSRGSHVVKFAMTESPTFKAGSAGDANWFSASGYFEGDPATRNLYTAVFGGSPFDPRAQANYRKLSPSFRAKDFSGPLLQQFASASAFTGLELKTDLDVARVPNELVFYENESHLFHEPLHRLSAMKLNLDWFDYWLRGLKDPNAARAAEYARWDKMREAWQKAKRAAHN